MGTLTRWIGVAAGACALMTGSAAHAEADAQTILSMIDEGNTTALYALNGYAGGLGWANTDLEHRGQPLLFCSPDDVAITPEQNVEILRRYVRANPRAAAVPAGLAMLFALKDAYPCEGSAAPSPGDRS